MFLRPLPWRLRCQRFEFGLRDGRQAVAALTRFLRQPIAGHRIGLVLFARRALARFGQVVRWPRLQAFDCVAIAAGS